MPYMAYAKSNSMSMTLWPLHPFITSYYFNVTPLLLPWWTMEWHASTTATITLFIYIDTISQQLSRLLVKPKDDNFFFNIVLVDSKIF